MKECGWVSVYLDGDSITEALTLVVAVWCLLRRCADAALGIRQAWLLPLGFIVSVCRRGCVWAGLAAAACLRLYVDGLFVWAGLAAAACLRLCVDGVVCVLNKTTALFGSYAVIIWIQCARSAITIACFVLSYCVQRFVSRESLLLWADFCACVTRM